LAIRCWLILPQIFVKYHMCCYTFIIQCYCISKHVNQMSESEVPVDIHTKLFHVEMKLGIESNPCVIKRLMHLDVHLLFWILQLYSHWAQTGSPQL
jgi:hypothetical protein